MAKSISPFCCLSLRHDTPLIDGLLRWWHNLRKSSESAGRSGSVISEQRCFMKRIEICIAPCKLSIIYFSSFYYIPKGFSINRKRVWLRVIISHQNKACSQLLGLLIIKASLNLRRGSYFCISLLDGVIKFIPSARSKQAKERKKKGN